MTPRDEPGFVLLDTSAIIAVLDPRDRWHAELGLQLKVAGLTADKFVLTDATLDELLRFVEHLRSRDTLAREVHRNLDWFLRHPRIERVRLSDLPLPRHFLDSPQARRLLDGSPRRRQPAQVAHDVVLLIAARHFAAPILTADRRLHQATARRTVFNVDTALPFDLAGLADLPLRDALEVGSPLRSVFQGWFAEFRAASVELMSARRVAVEQSAGVDLSKASEALATLASLDLEARLRMVDAAKLSWQSAATPDIKWALAWTVIDIAVASLGVPVPTSLLGYLLDVRRHEAKKSEIEPK